MLYINGLPYRSYRLFFIIRKVHSSTGIILSPRVLQLQILQCPIVYIVCRERYFFIFDNMYTLVVIKCILYFYKEYKEHEVSFLYIGYVLSIAKSNSKFDSRNSTSNMKSINFALFYTILGSAIRVWHNGPSGDRAGSLDAGSRSTLSWL